MRNAGLSRRTVLLHFLVYSKSGTVSKASEIDIASEHDDDMDMDKIDDLPSQALNKREPKPKPKPKARMIKLSKLAGKKKSAALAKHDKPFSADAPKTKWPTYTVPSGGWLVFNKKANSYAAHCHIHGAGRCRINKVLGKEPLGYLLKWLADAATFSTGV